MKTLILLITVFCICNAAWYGKPRHFLKDDYEHPVNKHKEIIDNSTNANIEQIVTEHLSLNLTLDFDKTYAYGSVTLNMRVLDEDLEDIILDARFLNISYVNVSGANFTEFYFKEPNPQIGPALHISTDLKYRFNQTLNVTIYYCTTDEGLSLNWLDPSQTAGGKYPYVYTHCEAIDCRCLSPLQDTPSVKATYSATIWSPPEIIVRMTGNTTSERGYSDYRVTTFEMNVPIPSYLIALAAGNLVYQKIGRNVGVITEPEMLNKSVTELENLQDSLDLAESFLTPYEWGNYTILILPPSFPFGGMENPLLTFASPSIIVGDKSQVDVATHEIAHSWTGNLVTNRNWENFWLNEGFTVFTERHVSRRQHGEEFYKVSSALGNSSLFSDMADFGFDSTFTSLHPNYEGANPYDTFSEVPYEKGFQFLTYIETLIGNKTMEAFLKTYVAKYKRQSIVYEQFWSTFNEFLNDTLGPEQAKNITDQIDLDTWVYSTGAPPVQLNFSHPSLDLSRSLAIDYIAKGGDARPDEYKKFFDFFSLLKCVFLTQLVDDIDKITRPIKNLIDYDYNLTETIDPEQKVLWYQVLIKTDYNKKAKEKVNEFLGSIGRLKYLRPLYRALDSYDHDTAVKTFRTHKPIYHPVAVARIKEILNIE